MGCWLDFGTSERKTPRRDRQIALEGWISSKEPESKGTSQTLGARKSGGSSWRGEGRMEGQRHLKGALGGVGESRHNGGKLRVMITGKRKTKRRREYRWLQEAARFMCCKPPQHQGGKRSEKREGGPRSDSMPGNSKKSREKKERMNEGKGKSAVCASALGRETYRMHSMTRRGKKNRRGIGKEKRVNSPSFFVPHGTWDGSGKIGERPVKESKKPQRHQATEETEGKNNAKEGGGQACVLLIAAAPQPPKGGKERNRYYWKMKLKRRQDCGSGWGGARRGSLEGKGLASLVMGIADAHDGGRRTVQRLHKKNRTLTIWPRGRLAGKEKTKEWEGGSATPCGLHLNPAGRGRLPQKEEKGSVCCRSRNYGEGSRNHLGKLYRYRWRLINAQKVKRGRGGRDTTQDLALRGPKKDSPRGEVSLADQDPGDHKKKTSMGKKGNQLDRPARTLGKGTGRESKSAASLKDLKILPCRRLAGKLADLTEVHRAE